MAPGTPKQNGLVESFNDRRGGECPNGHLFASQRHARHLVTAWRDDCNHHGSPASFDGLML
ncbi:MAG: integrase core domain-containing protein [Pseudodonghicola sp.]